MLFDCSTAAGVQDMFSQVNTQDFLDHMAKVFGLKAGSRLGSTAPEELKDFLKTALGNFPCRMITDALNKVGVLTAMGYPVEEKKLTQLGNEVKSWAGKNYKPAYSKPNYKGKNWRYFAKLKEIAAAAAEAAAQQEAAAAVPVMAEAAVAVVQQEAAVELPAVTTSTEPAVPVVQKPTTIESLLGSPPEYSAEAAVAEPDLIQKFGIDDLFAEDSAQLATEEAEHCENIETVA